MGKGVTVTSVLLGVFVREASYTGMHHGQDFISHCTRCVQCHPKWLLCVTHSPGRELWEFLGGRGLRWLEKDASVFQQLLSSGIATPQFFWHPEPWFAWQYQLSLLMQVPWAHPSLFLCSALLD